MDPSIIEGGEPGPEGAERDYTFIDEALRKAVEELELSLEYGAPTRVVEAVEYLSWAAGGAASFLHALGYRESMRELLDAVAEAARTVTGWPDEVRLPLLSALYSGVAAGVCDRFCELSDRLLEHAERAEHLYRERVDPFSEILPPRSRRAAYAAAAMMEPLIRLLERWAPLLRSLAERGAKEWAGLKSGVQALETLLGV